MFKKLDSLLKIMSQITPKTENVEIKFVVPAYAHFTYQIIYIRICVTFSSFNYVLYVYSCRYCLSYLGFNIAKPASCFVIVFAQSFFFILFLLSLLLFLPFSNSCMKNCVNDCVLRILKKQLPIIKRNYLIKSVPICFIHYDVQPETLNFL